MFHPGVLNLREPGVKPRLRGVSHMAAFFAALGAGSVLLSVAPSPRAMVAALVYTFGLVAMYGASALYHVPYWSERALARMRRIDHATIFLQIAGTYTPLCLLAMPSEFGLRLLTVVWVGAGLGMLRGLLWTRPPRWVAVALYLALGWAAVFSLPELMEGVGETSVTLILLGGLFYSAGAVMYALKRPNPWPRVFGVHEVFHLMVIIASVLHFIVIRAVVLAS